MAQRPYRANLSASQFPFDSNHIGEAVIVAGPDQTLSRYVDSTESRDASIGIPQLVSAINVLPTVAGYASAKMYPVGGWITSLPVGAEISPNILDCTLGEDNSPMNLLVYGYPAGGEMLLGLAQITQGIMTVLVAQPPPPPAVKFASGIAPAAATTTAAYLQGKQFVYVEGIGLIYISKFGNVYSRMLLSGIEATDIKGIVGAAGYLILFGDSAAAWSTTLALIPEYCERNTPYIVGEECLADGQAPSATCQLAWHCTTAGTTGVAAPAWPFSPLGGAVAGATVTDGTVVWTAKALSVDFVPSLTTGAGGGNIEELRGNIVTCRSTTSGFMVYTTANVVSAAFTNNAQFPFIYKDVSGANGILHQQSVTGSSNGNQHYALTHSGVQQISPLGAKATLAPITEALMSSKSSWLSVDTGEVTLVTVTDLAYAQVEFVADRYLCVSRGEEAGALADVLVYDTMLDRYGRLYLQHFGLFGMLFQAPIEQIAFCGLLGQLHVASIDDLMEPVDPEVTVELGVMALGPYKYVRAQNVMLHEVRLGAVMPDTVVHCCTLSEDGEFTNLGSSAMFDATGTSDLQRKRFLTRAEGDSIILVVHGRFSVATLSLTMTSGGHR